MLFLHSLLRWIILILILITIFQSFAARNKPASGGGLKKTSLFLLISAHLTFLIGLYLWIFGEWGLKKIQQLGFGEVMKAAPYRFWAVEHITGMLIATVLITVGRSKVKKNAYGAAGWLYVIALIIILASIPWPFREGIGRPLLPHA